jgi:cation diffusion facilitator family transporter
MNNAEPTNMKTSLSKFQSLRIWFGFAEQEGSPVGSAHGDAASGHGHTHGTVDATIATTTRGIWAIKWSFIILAITAGFQITVVLLSGSVALLADTIHNVGDAVTAVPLWIAFRLARRKPSARFTYGYGRVEDLAGAAIVFIILFSAGIAGYEAISRLLHPQPLQQLAWVMAAGVAGFIGNEVVAVFRIRVGREINSAALIADGYHARTDGLTSLAVVAGAIGVWLGFPLADPIIGLLITIAILGIVWQSAKAVFTRMLDGVEPKVIEEIRHSAAHIKGIDAVLEARARWLGHRLVAEVDVTVAGEASVREADALASAFEHELMDHLPALLSARVRVRPAGTTVESLTAHQSHAPHAAPTPVEVRGELASGLLEIIDTPDGERMRFSAAQLNADLVAEVLIHRPVTPDGIERLPLTRLPDSSEYLSQTAPAEPHEFSAELRLNSGGRSEVLPFAMQEPEGHHHG